MSRLRAAIRRFIRGAETPGKDLDIRLYPAEGLEKLGTAYGGWTVPLSAVNENSVCYCAGVGEDVSFDCELIKRSGCQVYCFDPTPRARAHMEDLFARTGRGEAMPINNSPDHLYELTEAQMDNLHFHALGVWSGTEVKRFYAPRNQRHVSHSILNLQGTADYFEAECRSIKDIMDTLGHSRLDLLKMDIEGAEYEAIRGLLRDGVEVGVLCVEFDEGNNPLDPGYLDRISAIIGDLAGAGLVPVHREAWNFTFLRREQTGQPARPGM